MASLPVFQLFVMETLLVACSTLPPPSSQPGATVLSSEGQTAGILILQSHTIQGSASKVTAKMTKCLYPTQLPMIGHKFSPGTTGQEYWDSDCPHPWDRGPMPGRIRMRLGSGSLLSLPSHMAELTPRKENPCPQHLCSDIGFLQGEKACL